MSSIAVNAITDASGGNTATINSYTPTESNMAGRNRIINGDMRIDQRNAGASVSLGADTSYLVDRFRFGTFSSGDGRLTGQQSSTAPDGFTNSLSMTVSTQDTSFSGTEGYFLAAQVIEGFNSADLMWGTANAKTVTVSFWVRSSVTGNFPFTLQNNSFETAYGALYTISSADTWEYKTITIPGATVGTWLANNGIGIRVIFGGGGKDPERTAPLGWNTVSARTMTTVTGATNLISTLNATWYITGVQLEVGSVATPFERRQYGQELALCQRYYEKSYGDGVVPGTSTTTGLIACSTLGGSVSYRFFPAGGGTYQVAKRTNSASLTFFGQDGTSGVLSQYNNSSIKLTISSASVGSNRKLPNYIATSTGNNTEPFVFHFTASDEL